MPRVKRVVDTRVAAGLAVALTWSVGTTAGGAAQDGTCAAPSLTATAAMPGGDAAGAAAQPGPAPESPGPCWTWSMDAYTMNADDNEILVIGDIVVTVAHDPTVIALDATDGTERWQYSVTDQGFGGVNGLAAGDGVVYAAGIDGLTALQASDGSVLWQYAVENPESPNPEWGGFFWPVAVGGSVYGATRVDDAAGIISYSLVALDAATGAERWALPLSPSEVGAPASDGTIVVVEFYTLEDDLRWPNLGAFDALTGESRWVSKIRDVEKWPTTRPVVTSDLVYLGNQDGEIVARSTADGSREWRANIGANPETITVVDGTLYATSPDSVVHALNARNGKKRWDATPKLGRITPAAIPAVVQDGPVIVGAADYDAGAWLYAFDPKTGKQVWRVESGPSGSGFMAPIVSGGRVVVGMKDSTGTRVVSFGTP